MANAGARAYNGGMGLCPQRGPGAEPLVGGQGRSPPEAESILWSISENDCYKMIVKLTSLYKLQNIKCSVFE